MLHSEPAVSEGVNIVKHERRPMRFVALRSTSVKA